MVTVEALTTLKTIRTTLVSAIFRQFDFFFYFLILYCRI